ncbi:NAD-dependent epimerase/dehydratase family protein [Pelagibacteraceae bacterium]|nr:NAD-dependent epimerase/dehydratase family protein [Pelagibacteraceae bacterium]
MKKKIAKKEKKNCDILLGSSGFIAQQFINRYENRNKFFICLDKKRVKYPSNSRFFKLNINNIIKLKKILKKTSNFYNFNTIWHFAANSDISKSNQDINIDLKDTFNTTLNVLIAIQDLKLRVKKINFSSSSAIYGEGENILMESKVDLKTISHYGSMKLSSEAILSSFCFLHKIKCKIFRFSNIIGPRMTHGLIFDLRNKIKKNRTKLAVLGNGTQTKQYLHIDDLITAMLLVQNKDSSNFNIYNISAGDSGISVKKIVNLFIKINNISPKIIFGKTNFGWLGDVPKFRFNVNKIKKLGWKPKMNSVLAIKKTIQQNLVF